MRLKQPESVLELEEIDDPSAGRGQVVIQVEACGVCRTDIHVQDGDIPGCRYPVTPGHQVVGTVLEVGDGATLKRRDRVGVPWLGWTCGDCAFCQRGEENLCDEARFTGCHVDGGFAEYMVADERYCFPLDDRLDPVQTAPLLCAGLIGYRAFRMTGEPRRLGIYGFGAAGHLLCAAAKHLGVDVYAFTRPDDAEGQEFARSLGAVWAEGSDERPDVELDAAIVFAPVGKLVPAALKTLRKGGRVVCAGIHMSDVPSFPYADLWGERRILSVANLTRQDGEEFLQLAAELDLRPQVTRYSLEQANQALDDLRAGRFQGAAVLVP
ncbi:MAG: zinc-dependent alcohol dehydrogenase family protein [Xanthomonadales bacterium]|nr:zinc-dependent alcohol dehydrogenase family protein [Xanthomonadales bacterium]